MKKKERKTEREIVRHPYYICMLYLFHNSISNYKYTIYKEEWSSDE